jgi:lipopolysaccharide transport system ATP-binding protein
MCNVALRMENVYKKFHKGQVYDSLRDLIPALTGRLFREPELNDEDEREFWALQDVSFEVKRGEAFGIIGNNGAGKSTALKILSRIMKPSKGSMLVNGRLSALLEVSAGFHPDLTGRENIFLNGTILGMKRRDIEARLDEIIAFSGIEEFIDTPVKRYSSGMHARLGFSVAAHVDPEVLLVDEVLSVGDYSFQQKCIQKLRAVIQSGATVLFVSHNLRTVAEFCQRCLLLEHGRTAALGPTNEVVATYIRRQRATAEQDSSQRVAITKLVVRNQDQESARFQSGEKAWIDIEVHARQSCRKLSISLYLSDSAEYLIFNTSLERLGYSTFDLEAGQVFRCTFEVTLNLAIGTFHVSSLVYRYDTQTEYTRWMEAATIFVAFPQDIRGVVNCFPRLVSREIHEERPLARPVAIVAALATVDNRIQRATESLELKK